jgi:hypothetical protein
LIEFIVLIAWLFKDADAGLLIRPPDVVCNPPLGDNATAKMNSVIGSEGGEALAKTPHDIAFASRLNCGSAERRQIMSNPDRAIPEWERSNYWIVHVGLVKTAFMDGLRPFSVAATQDVALGSRNALEFVGH